MNPRSSDALSRREFLEGSAAAMTLAAGLPLGVSAMGQDAYEESLKVLRGAGPEYAGGLANHGPMAAEAYVALGCEDRVLAWVRGYRKKLDEGAPKGDSKAIHDWHGQLGSYSDWPHWLAFFEGEIQRSTWRKTLAIWLPRLAPGMAGAAAHGLLRTAYAARGLSVRETPLRREELAQGLAYWAARYAELPGNGGLTKGTERPVDLVRHIEVHQGPKTSRGLISDGIKALADFPPFQKTAPSADLQGEAGAILSSITLACAQGMVTNLGRGNLFAMTHAVTGPSSLRMLLPHADPEDLPLLLHHAWRLGFGLLSAFGSAAKQALPRSVPSSRDDLVARALKVRDEHGMKLLAACAEESAILSNPVFLIAAEAGIEKFENS